MTRTSARFAQLFAREISQAEGVKSAAMALLFGLAMVNGLVLAWRVPVGLLRAGVAARQLYGIALLGGLAGLLELLMWLLVRQRTRRELAVPAWLGWALTIFESLLPTAVLLAIGTLILDAHTFGAPAMLFYGVVLTATALSLNPLRSLLAGGVAAASHLGLALLLGERGQMESPLSSALAVPLARAFLILLLAGAAALGAQQLRRRIAHAVAASEEHDRVVRVFGRYLSDEVVEVLLHQPGALGLGGQKRTVSILLTDLRGFSNLCERLPPDRVVHLLNHYLGTMTEVIHRHGGTIDEFIGDAILVIFGAPLAQPDHAVRAVRCALAMQLSMAAVNLWNREHELPAIEMGIGIHSGDVVVGNIGSEQRQKYGAVGSTVNLAARIESYTVGGQVLISAATAAAVGAGLRVRQELCVHPKGAALPVRIVDIAGHDDLQLPAVELELREITPLPVQLRSVEGKELSGRAFAAQLLALSELGARVRCAEPLAPWQNLAMELGGGFVFAKVVEAGELSTLRFVDCDEPAKAARAQALKGTEPVRGRA